MNQEAKDWAEVTGILCAIVVIFVVMFLLATTPFALLGWILLSFVNMFGLGVLTSYFNCAITGVVFGIALRLGAG